MSNKELNVAILHATIKVSSKVSHSVYDSDYEEKGAPPKPRPQPNPNK